jgi:hypothetical protein
MVYNQDIDLNFFEPWRPILDYWGLLEQARILQKIKFIVPTQAHSWSIFASSHLAHNCSQRPANPLESNQSWPPQSSSRGLNQLRRIRQ